MKATWRCLLCVHGLVVERERTSGRQKLRLHKTLDFVPVDLRKSILIVVIRLTSLNNRDAYTV